jgi:hypothetical protein
MGKKIFVSYKFNDDSVYPLNGKLKSTVRDYVDILEEKIDTSCHIYKGESNDDDLSGCPENYIWEQLKPRIYDSSITIIMISPNMRDYYRTESTQWIPWEISYSLKETTRNDRTSHSNAVFSVVLPYNLNTYDYFVKTCNHCFFSCNFYNSYFIFPIIYSNMLNKCDINYIYCNKYGEKIISPYEESSYIFAVKWNDFIADIDYSINRAMTLQRNIYNYNITKVVNHEY